VRSQDVGLLLVLAAEAEERRAEAELRALRNDLAPAPPERGCERRKRLKTSVASFPVPPALLQDHMVSS
jgi:hypothetical protein